MGSTIKDIAVRAGVSPSTVSRILGNYGYASEATRKRVLKASRELHYRPNSIAKSMVKGRTNSIGLVVADSTNPFFIAVINEVEAQARKRGYSLLISNTGESHEIQEQVLDSLLGRQVDGLILVPAESSKPDMLNQISSSHHMVCLDRYIPGVHADFVLFDNLGSTYRHSRLFLESASQAQVALVYPDQQISPILHRLEGFYRAVSDLGINEQLVSRIPCGISSDDARRKVGALLDQDPCSRFFTLDSQMTEGTLRSLYERNMIGREAYRLLTFDSIGTITDMLPYHITPIMQPVQELARSALQKLIERIDHSDEQYSPITITLSG